MKLHQTIINTIEVKQQQIPVIKWNRMDVINAENMGIGQEIADHLMGLTKKHKTTHIQKTPTEHWTNGPATLLCKQIHSTIHKPNKSRH